MKNDAPRPTSTWPQVRTKTSWQWEHIQIDIEAKHLSDGERLIHCFRDAGVELHAIVVDEAILDFRIATVAPVVPTLPPFDLSSESYGPYRHSLVYRSWRIPSMNLTIHAESWVDKGKGGFVDVFMRSGQ